METCTEINVQKRDGTFEPFQVDKINKVLNWATEGINGVSVSDIEMYAKLNIINKIETKDIHKVLIETSANLFNESYPNYQWVASRLLNYQIRKDVWGGKNPPKLLDFIKSAVDKGVYDGDVLTKYSEEEINKLGEVINHDRDYNFTYAGIKQLCDKYLIQDRKTNKIFETPQFAYMLISMISFMNYGKDRLNYVKKAYTKYSKFKINLPTPQMAGIRTKLRAYSSCCLIDIDDTKESLFHNNTAIGFATAQRYGIGINIGRIRAKGTGINNNTVVHTGLIPFLKVYEATVKSLQQNGLRGGGGTVHIPFWHLDIEEIIVLRNNGGTDESRVRDLDYSVQFSKIFFDRFIKDEYITLFSPHEVPLLTDTFGMDDFDKHYLMYEKDSKIKYKKKIKASQLMSLYVKERTETGRIYAMNIDHCNSHGAFKERVVMSNLCQEITFPTKPIKHVDDTEGEIGICVLSAINLLEIKDEDDLKETCDIIVRMLDELIDYQKWFSPAAENFITKRRALGIGLTNFAAYMAKNNIKYTDAEAPNFADEIAEKVQYYLLRSSCDLAKEKGPCEKFNLTKYSDGILPLDTYKKKVDTIVTRQPSKDWESLRKDIVTYGLRNSVLTAQMPVESCQTLDTKIQTPDGVFELGELLKNSGLDFQTIEDKNAIGWYELPNEFTVKTLEGNHQVKRAYYNGKSEDIYEIEFEDGEKYKFTGNHKLLVKRNNINVWIRVEDLEENDDIIKSVGHLKIKKITKIESVLPTWDIEVENVHHYALSNGCIAHNSSVIQNTTNGIEPVRSLMTYKTSKKSTLPVLVPNYSTCKNKYTMAFEMKSNIGLINIVAAIQKWFDQSISTNLYYNYDDYPDRLLPDAVVIKDILHAYSMGVKTLYYSNTSDGDKQSASGDSGCAGGACTL